VIVDWASDRLTLTDFGVAHLADGERTATGVVLGSPGYMAPEQLAGAPAAPSGDLYALGVLLFELLAGRRPHDAPSMGELLRRVATEAAPALTQFRPGLPPAFDRLVAALLAKSSAGRPTDAGEVGSTLAAIAERLLPQGDGPKSRA
jgi:serine/threonine-protein kinase